MVRVEYLVVGCGLAGRAVAERIAGLEPGAALLQVGGGAGSRSFQRAAASGAESADSTAPPDSGVGSGDQPGGLDWVSRLDLERRQALLEGGQVVEYRRLCLCTGAKPVRPEFAGGSLGHVCVCRSAVDEARVEALLGELAAAGRGRVVVFGGGCQAAAFLNRILAKAGGMGGLLGGDWAGRVTLLHRRRHFWGRWLDEETAEWMTQQIGALGVEMRMREEVKGLEGRLLLRNVQTKSGHRFAAALGLVGWGTRPRLELVEGTPLGYPQGIPVDDFLETEEKGVYAVGEVAACPPGGGLRVDVKEGILRQADVAAWNMTGRERRRFEWVYRRRVEFLGLRFEFLGDCEAPARRWEREGRPGEGFVLRRYGDRGLAGVVLCEPQAEVAEAVEAELRQSARTGSKMGSKMGPRMGSPMGSKVVAGQKTGGNVRLETG
jgi:NADPH-dependent 2,4-dienoyl-CoA reductase/sulfur reductase-like enzyme